MSTALIRVREEEAGLGSPAKEKAATRGLYSGRWPLLLWRLRHPLCGAASKLRLLSCVVVLGLFLLVGSRLNSFMGWNFHHPSSVSSPSRGGYTVLINTWNQNNHFKQIVGHYASCAGTHAIRVIWSQSGPPQEKLKSHLNEVVASKSHKHDFKFDIISDGTMISRFRPSGDIRTDAVFSVDDDVIIPCPTLDFAFTVWQSAPSTMVGFVPRAHLPEAEINGVPYYKYEGWWPVWRKGTYSMILAQAAFFHRKYLDMYTSIMPSTVYDYLIRERICEDVAMSLLIANASGSPPIWVKGKTYKIGTSGTSRLEGQTDRRSRCLNELLSLYETVPLMHTNVKAVDARQEWFW
ncbi:glycosylinositol phosphorylceramide mannosyl transferase 1-like [Rhodamnia argentea]|uniref:Glycosylinositol phosphorylceramide mannosyl transferase 1-like n=1 Tax=Rhodamnia argentea TaxID=178133 RepID=A0A8B8PBA5_9MYRT|nr:glycosylinositol phosphorylceramide mannosyl transferase 1-like [Rhodamnia argentea]